MSWVTVPTKLSLVLQNATNQFFDFISYLQLSQSNPNPIDIPSFELSKQVQKLLKIRSPESESHSVVHKYLQSAEWNEGLISVTLFEEI